MITVIFKRLNDEQSETLCNAFNANFKAIEQSHTECYTTFYVCPELGEDEENIKARITILIQALDLDKLYIVNSMG